MSSERDPGPLDVALGTFDQLDVIATNNAVRPIEHAYVASRLTL